MKKIPDWAALLGLLAAISLAFPHRSAGEPNPEEPGTPVPFQISFLTSNPPGPEPPVLIVQTKAQVWPAAATGELQVELLLRLPEGLLLESRDWTQVEQPPEQSDQASGPWTLFQRTIPVRVSSAKELPSELLRETVPLRVVKEGSNWVITVRARVVKGSESWENFGVLFATLEGDAARFHEIPQVQQ